MSLFRPLTAFAALLGLRSRLVPLLTVVLALPLIAAGSPSDYIAAGSPSDYWAGPYFGDGNLPPGCIRDISGDEACYHMRTGLNGLDTPSIDVLVLAPLSPAVERDLRITTESVEMWAGGIEYLAREMGMDWLADGVDFRLVVNHVDLVTGAGTADFSTYPLWDPEIVVVVSNPVGGAGIGVDPLDFSADLLEIMGIEGVREGPCHGVQNPFDFASWEALPGFDNHHGENTGTYHEDCDGAGGNVCFAVNGAIDPTPGMDVDYSNPVVGLPFGLFNLVAHEIGHCLTLGHVGDALDHTSPLVPTYDIMAYDEDPIGQTKCVSTLDVEVFATRMSNFLDVNGDGAVDEGDLLLVNDQVGDHVPGQPLGNAFHVQHPDDHWYASSTGSPWDCPQPDQGAVPGEGTNWTPEPDQAEKVLTITNPADGATTGSSLTVGGTAERRVDRPTWEAGETRDSQSSDSSTTALPAASMLSAPEVVEFQGTFLAADTTLGAHEFTAHHYSVDVTEPSDVVISLGLSNEIMGGTDLDLYVTGARTESGAEAGSDERLTFDDVVGTLDIMVDPWMVTEPLGVDYTVTVTMTPAGDDGGTGGDDPVGDDVAGDPSLYHADETVSVLLEGQVLGSQEVRTRRGEVAEFSIPVSLEPGTYTLTVEWTDRRGSVAVDTVTVTVDGGKVKGGGKGGPPDRGCDPQKPGKPC